MYQPRLEKCFDELKRLKKKALIPYITAGDPLPELTVRLMHALVESGADVIELGVPFSDPIADGPIIQRASEKFGQGKNSTSKFIWTRRQGYAHGFSISLC